MRLEGPVQEVSIVYHMGVDRNRGKTVISTVKWPFQDIGGLKNSRLEFEIQAKSIPAHSLVSSFYNFYPKADRG